MLIWRLLQRVPCARARVSAPRGDPLEHVPGAWNCAGAQRGGAWLPAVQCLRADRGSRGGDDVLLERLMQWAACASANVSAPRGHPPEHVPGAWSSVGA